MKKLKIVTVTTVCEVDDDGREGDEIVRDTNKGVVQVEKLHRGTMRTAAADAGDAALDAMMRAAIGKG